jgi:hypothetical protein
MLLGDLPVRFLDAPVAMLQAFVDATPSWWPLEEGGRQVAPSSAVNGDLAAGTDIQNLRFNRIPLGSEQGVCSETIASRALLRRRTFSGSLN